ncbi:MAG: rhomboid family intramembrane serine protease [Planctomycetaceae bacterium]
MSEQHAESDSLPVVPFKMTAGDDCGNTAGRLSGTRRFRGRFDSGSIAVSDPGADRAGKGFFRPATVDCNEHHLLLNAFAQMTTQRENVEHLFFNDGAGIVFRDVESVSLAGTGLSDRRQQNSRSALKGSFRKTGTHVSLQGFSMDKVESLRERPGMAPPEPGSKVHILEQYHRSLIERTPVVWISPLLIGLNVGMFVVVAAASGSLLSITIPAMIAWGADYGPLTLAGDWWRLVACTFLHWGLFHLLCNLWGLHQGGRVMERLAGNFGFLVLYLFSGIAGSLLSIRWSPDAVCAGASGAVFGICGALGAWHFRRRQDIPDRIVREVRSSTIPFPGFNLLIGLGVPGINQAAHIGGLVAGILSGLILAGSRSTDLQAGRQLRLQLRSSGPDGCRTKIS